MCTERCSARVLPVFRVRRGTTLPVSVLQQVPERVENADKTRFRWRFELVCKMRRFTRNTSDKCKDIGYMADGTSEADADAGTPMNHIVIITLLFCF